MGCQVASRKKIFSLYSSRKLKALCEVIKRTTGTGFDVALASMAIDPSGSCAEGAEKQIFADLYQNAEEFLPPFLETGAVPKKMATLAAECRPGGEDTGGDCIDDDLVTYAISLPGSAPNESRLAAHILQMEVRRAMPIL